jgi:hypothetical protein
MALERAIRLTRPRGRRPPRPLTTFVRLLQIGASHENRRGNARDRRSAFYIVAGRAFAGGFVVMVNGETVTGLACTAGALVSLFFGAVSFAAARGIQLLEKIAGAPGASSTTE